MNDPFESLIITTQYKCVVLYAYNVVHCVQIPALHRSLTLEVSDGLSQSPELQTLLFYFLFCHQMMVKPRPCPHLLHRALQIAGNTKEHVASREITHMQHGFSVRVQHLEVAGASAHCSCCIISSSSLR